MAANALLQRELTRNELCNLDLDTFEKIRQFRQKSRRRGDMETVIRNVRRGLSEDYLSRKRVRHDALELIRTGDLPAGCVPELPIQCLNRLAVQMDANDAAAFSLTGNLVDSWTNSAGSVPVTYAGSGTARPDRGGTLQNGLPVVTADGVDDFLSAGSVAGLELQEFTWFMVVSKLTSFTDNSRLMTLQSNNDQAGGGAEHAGFWFQWGGNNPSPGTVEGNYVTGTNTLQPGFGQVGGVGPLFLDTFFLMTVSKVAASNLVTYRLNGSSVNTVDASLGSATLDFTSVDKKTVLFAEVINGAAAAFADMRIAEYLLYDVAKNDAEQAPINAYMNAKWGLGF